MNVHHRETPPFAEVRRQGLRDALARLPVDGLEALESRRLEQWRQRSAASQHRYPGPLAAPRAGWRHHPAHWSGALLALGMAALMLLKPWAQPDPGFDEPMRPDMLTPIAIGGL